MRGSIASESYGSQDIKAGDTTHPYWDIIREELISLRWTLIHEYSVDVGKPNCKSYPVALRDQLNQIDQILRKLSVLREAIQ
jgi:hypothetical protein